MPVPSTTTTLLARARADARDGFAGLHHRHASRLAVWVSLHVGPALRQRVSVEDLVQEIWGRAYAGFGGFDPARASFRAWLFGIAHNVLREQMRSLGARVARDGTRTDAEVGAVEPHDGRTSIPSTLVAREERELVADLVARLPLDERRLATWRGLEGLSYAEIGCRLGVGARAAESRWRRLVARLRERLGADSLLDPDLEEPDVEEVADGRRGPPAITDRTIRGR